MSDPVCVRFAPSPTGHLHVGGVRTALFNWLFARSQGGRFVLRIEDTDRERSKPEHTAQILESLQWLGLDWDDEPVMQSGRDAVHAQVLERMLSDGTAFRCFVPQEEARAAVERNRETDGPIAFFSPDRNLAPDEAKRRAEAGEPHVIRFRCPEGETAFTDLIRGEIRIDNEAVGDLVLARSDGTPTYNFVVVVDDSDMAITHVIRGEDHISNTTKQILLFEAIGRHAPVYAHLPLINGPDKRKLSKRHGAVTTDQYRAIGILPDTLVNYLALLGWSPGTDQEVFSRQQLLEQFSIDRVGKSAAVFDQEKLRWLNGIHLRDGSDDAFVAWARQAPGLVDHPRIQDEAWFRQTVLLMKERARTWEELEHLLEPLLSDDLTYEEGPVKKHLGKDTAQPVLVAVRARLEAADKFDDPTALETILREEAERMDLKFGLLVHPCRVSLTGRDKGAGLTEVMVALGRERCLERLARGAEMAAAQASSESA